MLVPVLQVKVTLEEVKVDPGGGVRIWAEPVAGVGVGVGAGVGVAVGVGVPLGVGVGVGVGADVPVSAAIRLAPLGVPQPVQRS